MRGTPGLDNHGLTDEILYGPVLSRRYGRAIGVNILPASTKLCSFNCLYCQLGKKNTYSAAGLKNFPSLQRIRSELTDRLADYLLPDTHHIVISGNGEPTLHPQFGAIARILIEIRDKLPQRIPVVCLTNGSTLSDPAVFKALQCLDECSIKLDSGLNRIDCPAAPLDLEQFLTQARRLKNRVVQSCFVTGSADNTATKDLHKWMIWLEKLAPRRIDLYTVTRQPAHAAVRPVSNFVLNEIAHLLRKSGFSHVRVCD